MVINISQADNSIPDWLAQHKDFNDRIQFVKKNNVYLIIAESYPNREALKKIYNFNNANFYKELKKRNFTLHHNCFSNYTYTFASLPSLFGMEQHRYSINLGNFDSVGGRSLLEGTTYNPVVDIFRQNTYRIQYFAKAGGLITKGASVDYYWPTPPVYLALERFLTHQDNTRSDDFDLHGLTLSQELTDHLSQKGSDNKSTFTFIYTPQPGHSPSRHKSMNWTELRNFFKTFRQGHHVAIEKANTQLLRIVDIILHNDDDPLIIIAGDHGPWGYRWEIDANGNKIPESLEYLDKFGVLMAIRFPADYQHQFDKEFRTHVNLFRYVFAYLSGDDKILETKADNNLYISKKRMGKLTW